MSDEIKTNKPKVGIRGNPSATEVYKSSERLQGAGSIPDFSTTLNQIATSPTMLGVLGSTLMTSASIALGQRFGQSLGKNPQGNLLPPVTNFDKTVSQAYQSQVEVTLGNEAQAMMYKAEEEMAKYPKLNPGLIQSYAKNMEKGLNQAIELAPDNLKPSLEKQFKRQLQSNVHTYNTRLISQQKSDSESNAAVWRIHQNDSVTNLVKDAKTPEDFKAAEDAYQSLQKNIQNSNSTPAQKDTALTTAKLNYESAKSIQKLMKARDEGTESKYLSSIADKKIEGLSWSESEAVRDNTVKYLSAVETADHRDQALLISDASLKIASRQFDESQLAALRDTLTPANFNQVAFNFAKAQSRNNKDSATLKTILSEPSNATTYEGLTAKEINGGFDMLTRDALQKASNNGNPINQDEAEFQAASMMNTVVPKYIDRLNREMANGNPEQVLAALDAESRLHELDGNKVLGLDDKALMSAEIFKNMLASNLSGPITALNNAREVVYNKDDATIKANRATINNYLNQNASTPERRLSTAIKLSGLANSKTIDNKAAFQADVYSRFSGYMNLSDGDVELSKKRLQADISKIWGETRVNGKSEITRLGVEQALSVPDNAAPFIQEDVITQLKPQLDALKVLYDKGGSPHYWRIKEGRTNYSEYATAKDALDRLSLSDKEYAKHQQLIKKYESGPPIEIEQVSKNGSQTWHVEVSSSAFAQRSPVTGQVSGFNIWVRHPETGEMGALNGYYGSTHVIPTYTPNREWIEHGYTSYLPNTGISAKDYIESRLHPKPIKSAHTAFELSFAVNKELNQ